MDAHPAPDGLIRRLWPSDTAGFRDHLLRLDVDSRHSRFGGAVSDDFLVGYADRCFGIDDVIYGYLVDGVVRGAGELRGVGHNLPLGFGGSAEAAFSVEMDWRRRGVGSELMARIVRAARLYWSSSHTLAEPSEEQLSSAESSGLHVRPYT